MSKSIFLTVRGALLALALAAFLLAGCGGSGDSATTGDAPQKGGTLALAEVEEVETFVPPTPTGESSVHMIGQIIEPLIRINAKSELEPWLAKSYEASSDKLTWTFELQEGVEFSNGQPLTAEDVVFSLDNVKKSVLWSFLFERIKSIRAAGPTTVVIEMTEPDSSLLAELSIFSAGIVPKNYGGLTEKEFGERPIGTGPFVLDSWQRGQQLTLTKNPRYWRQGEPLLDRVEVKTVTDANSRVSQLRSGDLEAILAPTPSQIGQLEQEPGVAIGRYAWALINITNLSAKSATFKDPRAREAFDLAIDRQNIIDAVTAGNGEPAGSWVPRSVPNSDRSIEPTVQDQEKAKQLLAEAVEDGVDPSFTLIYQAEDPYWTATTQIMQQQLEEVGFQLKLRPLDVSAVQEALYGGDFEAICFTGGKPDIPDTSEFNAVYAVTEGIGTGAPTEEIARLTEEARSTFDAEKRDQLYFKTQQIVDEEHFLITLDEQQFTWALKDNIAGFDANLTGRPTLAEAGFSG